MPPVHPNLGLQQFLLAFASMGAEAGLGGSDPVIPAQSRGTDRDPLEGGPPTSRPQTSREALRTEVLRHTERTMTVVSRNGNATMTRCQACPYERTLPCRALRLLALPYALHPAYRPEWHTDPPPSTTTADVEGL